MKVTKRQLRRLIREAIDDPKPATKISVEWDLGDNPDPGLPPIVDLPLDVVAEYEEYLAEYGEQEAQQAISDWLDDEYGFLSQWNFV
jgi:hypothetical protein